ncbi:hypothetical protein IL306_003246 [Fusarium sp. DS 682]|nr:hypothetical protein IL306_003246 [Fusarium sp. DS 682]
MRLADSWEIDDSCNGEKHAKLETAFSDIIVLISKVTLDLSKVQQPQPVTQFEKLSWDRVARNLAGLFGITPPDDKTNSGYDPEEKHFKQVLYTFNRMYQGLVQGNTIPEKGFSSQLEALGIIRKPLLMCGDTSGWQFCRSDADDVYDRTKKVRDVFPDTRFGDGAYIHANRYLVGLERDNSPRMCPAGRYGVTYQSQDLITICDAAFNLKNEKSPVRDVGEIKEGTNLDKDNFGENTLVRIMIHEFAHYYGSHMNGGNLERGKFWAFSPAKATKFDMY